MHTCIDVYTPSNEDITPDFANDIRGDTDICEWALFLPILFYSLGVI